MPYGREELNPVAHDLVARGFAVWNLEYRRFGAPCGGWPGTFLDVALGIDHLATLAAEGTSIDLDRVAVVGHSAGGHLALWGAQRDAKRSNGHGPSRVKLAAVAGLAPVADLAYAHELGVGNNAVAELLGGSPAQQPERYRTASPIALLPLGLKQLLMHGGEDEVVPVQISRRYARAAIAAGDSIAFVDLEGVGHMDFLDPSSSAHASLCEWLTRI